MKRDVIWLVRYLASCIEEYGIVADVVVVEDSFYRRLQLGLTTKGFPSPSEIGGVSVAGVLLVRCEEEDMKNTMIEHGGGQGKNVLAITKSPNVLPDHNMDDRMRVEHIMRSN
jgi:hypothetical protein